MMMNGKRVQARSDQPQLSCHGWLILSSCLVAGVMQLRCLLPLTVPTRSTFSSRVLAGSYHLICAGTGYLTLPCMSFPHTRLKKRLIAHGC